MTLKLAQADTFDPSKRGFGAKLAADKKSADVWVYEEIGSGWMGGLSAKDFANTIKGLGKVDTINVFMNSPGGSVFDGQAMYSTLKRNAARIVVHIDGLAASIASLIAMAGDEIRISAGGMAMIHSPWTVAAGNAEQMRETADVLDKIESELVDIYTARTGGDRAQIQQWVSEETWMTADEAVERGFADEKTEELKVAACAFDLKAFGYKHAPSVPSVVPAVATIAPAEDEERALRHRIIDAKNDLRQMGARV